MQREIDAIRAKIAAMSALSEKALRDCVRALADRDGNAAYAIILRDRHIDAIEKEIERLCLEFIVRQQPVAGPLRFAYSAIKINLELERVGDYAESIARQILKLLDQDAQFPMDRFTEMANLSIPMLNDAVRAFLDQDGDLARKTIDIEETVDALKRALAKHLVELARQDHISLEALSALITIGRRLERVSDQARNICMEVLYMCTGENPRHPEADVFRILFVDESNSCRSQMAEAIAASMGVPNFIFASAGVDPAPVSPAMIAFMKDKGLDVSRATPKAIHQVPNLDHYAVIVTLAPQAKKAFPRQPRKIIGLDWSVRDPSKISGSPEEIRAAYEGAFEAIRTHVRNLVEAILGTRLEDTK